MNAVIGKNPKKITPIQDQNPTTTLTFFRIQTGNGRNQQVHPVVKKCRHLATKIQNKRKRKKRSTRGLLFGRPFRKPPNSKRRPECQKCEKKRSSCTNVSNFCAQKCCNTIPTKIKAKTLNTKKTLQN